MENHDCRKSQVSHFFKNKSTPWLHDLTLAQHPTVKAAAIFRDKFCLIGFVFVTTAVIFILYYLSFMMKASPFRVLCWMIKKVFTGPKVNCAREFNAWRSPTSAVPRLPLPTLYLLMPILTFFMYNMNFTQKGMSATNQPIPKIILAKIIWGHSIVFLSPEARVT